MSIRHFIIALFSILAFPTGFILLHIAADFSHYSASSELMNTYPWSMFKGFSVMQLVLTGVALEIASVAYMSYATKNRVTD